MNQIGQTLHLTAVFNGLPPGVPVTYVWRWWDGSVTATTTPSTTKTLNKGGNPANSQLLYFTVTAALPDAQHLTTINSVQVNWPPMIQPSPTVSRNDEFFPYTSQVALTAWDVEQGGALSFVYTLAGTVIGNGSSSPSGLITSTYDGTTVQVYGTNNTFNRTVNNDETIRLHVIDAQSGTRVVDFDFVGDSAPPPTIGVSAGPRLVTSDATSLPDQRIGVNEYADFVVYASHPVSNTFDFLWSFFGSHGWATNLFSTGTTTTLATGGVKNDYIKALAGETGGTKKVVITVRNTTTGEVIEELIDVTLVANQTAATATLKAFQGASELANETLVAAGSKIEFTVQAADPDFDLVSYFWQFSQPSPVLPASLKLWGPKVLVDTTGYPSGAAIQGTMTASDRFGATVLFNVSPTIRIV